MRHSLRVWLYLVLAVAFVTLTAPVSLMLGVEENELLTFITEGVEYNNLLLGAVKGHFTIQVTEFDAELHRRGLEKRLTAGLSPGEKATTSVVGPVKPSDVEPGSDEDVSEYQYNILWARKGRKARLDVNMTLYDFTQGGTDLRDDQYFFDGETTTVYSKRQNRALVGYGPEEIRDNIYPTDFGLEYMRQPIGQILRQKQIKLCGDEKIGDTLCYVVEIYEENAIKGRLWLAPEMGFLSLRREYYNDYGAVAIRVEVKKAEQFAGQAWFPIEGVMEVFTFDTEKKVIRPFQRVLMKADDLEVNAEIPDEFFEMTKFPEGTIVQHVRTGLN